MKDLVAGMCAGVVVGVVGLAAGLTLVPVRDHQAIRGGDRPVAGPVSTPPSIFAGDAELDRAEPVDQGLDDSIFAEGEPADDALAAAVDGALALDESREQATAVTDISAAPGEGAAGIAAEVSPLPEPATTTDGEAAAQLRPAPEDSVVQTGAGTQSAQVIPSDGAEALPPPAPQIIAPRAPAAISVQTDGPGLAVDAATDGPGNEAEAQPPAPDTPEPDLAPPAFDGGLPTPPESLPAGILPQVGDEAAALIDAEDDRPALVRNAAAEPPFGNLPLLAVVLVDRAGSDPITGVPLSVAIAADAEDAGVRAEAWRAAGAEIVAIPDLPTEVEGTRPVAPFDATFEALPRAATVMPESAQGFTGGPIMADEIAAALAETGHGLILRSGTADPFARAAERAGVPAVSVFRRVDGSGRDGRAVARFLDQAAFEARNRGAVVVIADNAPETAEGLERFLDGTRADTVALVPVSAILRAR